MKKYIKLICLIIPIILLGACKNDKVSHDISGKITLEESKASKVEWEDLGSVTAYTYDKYEWDYANPGWRKSKHVEGKLYAKDNGSHILYKIIVYSKEYTIAKYSGEFDENAKFSMDNETYYLNVPLW